MIRIAGIGSAPTPVPDEEIEAVARVAAIDSEAEPVDAFRAGQNVRIIDGPLAGVCGTVMKVNEGLRVVVAITMLRRAVATKIDADAIELLAA